MAIKSHDNINPQTDVAELSFGGREGRETQAATGLSGEQQEYLNKYLSMDFQSANGRPVSEAFGAPGAENVHSGQLVTDRMVSRISSDMDPQEAQKFLTNMYQAELAKVFERLAPSEDMVTKWHAIGRGDEEQRWEQKKTGLPELCESQGGNGDGQYGRKGFKVRSQTGCLAGRSTGTGS